MPDPKKKSWAEDKDVGYYITPRTSFAGIYLTGNLMTAYSSATRTAGPHEEHIEEKFTDEYIVQDGSGKDVNEPLKSEVFEEVLHV